MGTGEDATGMPGLGEGGMPDMAEMMKMMPKGEDGKPDMSALMSMLGSMGGGGDGGEGGGKGSMGGKGGMMGGKGGMMGGKGGGKGQSDDSEKQGDGYVWQQKGEEIQVRIEKGPENVTKKDVKVTFKRFALKVEVKGEVVMDVKLAGAVEVDDCFWSIDPDSKKLQIMLTKQDESSNWSKLLEE